MAFKVPDTLAGSGGLSVQGDIEIDAFDNTARISATADIPITVRKNSAGSDFTRSRLNFIEGTNITLTIADDPTDDEVDITIESSGGGGLSPIADDTFLANISGSSATPTAVALTTLAGAGLTGGADAILAVGAGTGITVNADDIQLSAIAAESFFINGTAGAAVATAIAGSTVAGAGLTYTTGGILAVGAGTGITVNANDVQLSTIVDDSFMANVSGGAAVATGKTFASFAGVGLTYNATTHELDWDGVGTFGELPDLPGLSVLGRAANSTGDAAAITATLAKQVLRNRGTVVEWEYPVSVGSPFTWIFDGVDDQVSMGDVLDMTRTTPRSIFVWYSTTDTSGPCLIGKQANSSGAGWRFTISTTSLDLIIRGTSQQLQVGATSRPPRDGSEHIFGFTYTGSSTAAGVTMYLDGVSVAKTVGTDNLTSDSTVNAQSLQLGMRGTPPDSAYAGGIRHVSVWNRDLTSGEVLQLYGGGSPPDLSALSFFADCIGWWKLDESDTTGAGGVADYSASNNDGTASGGLAPTGDAEQVHTFQFTGGIASTTLSGVSIVSRSALTGAIAASASGTTTLFSGIRDNGSAENDRTNLNFLSSTSCTAVVTDDSGNDELEITFQRAALTGAITASANSNATAFGTLAAKSVLANATNATAVPAALAGSAAFQHLRVNSANTALEWSILGSAEFPAMAAGSVLANVTAGSAVPTAHDLATLAGGGLTYTNVTGIMAVGAGTGITVNANDVQLSTIAADSFFVNGTGSPAVATAIAGSTVAGAGLTYTTGGILAVGAGSAITVNANDVAVTDAGITPAKLSVISSSVAPTITIYASYAAGAGGAADDVTIFSSNAPFNFRITEVIVYTATAVALSTVTLRSATGGGGSALSSAISTTIPGQTSNNNTATTTVATNGTLVVRRSDSGIAGEIVIFAVKT